MNRSLSNMTGRGSEPPCRSVGWTRCLLGLLILLSSAYVPRSACAQYQAADVEEEEEELEAEEQVEAAVQFEMAPESFDAWLFQNKTMQRTPRQLLDGMLNLQLEGLNEVHSLTDAQRQKLQLAGTGDIERFLDRVDIVRAKFMASRHDQNAMNNLWQDIHPLQLQFQKLFDRHSLFQKALLTTLDAAQREEYQRVEQERLRYRFRAKVALALMQFEITVPVTTEQHEQLVDLVVRNTPPPKAAHEYEYYFALYSLARIPEAEFAKVLNPSQCATLQRHLEQGRNMGPFLMQNGLIDLDPAQQFEARPANAP